MTWPSSPHRLSATTTEFKRQMSALLRACGVPVGIVEGRAAEGTGPDLVVVDIRGDASSGMAAIERLRATSASLAIFVIAAAPEPDLILQAMRAGANEFFPWAAVDGSPASKASEESFHGAVRRTAARREAATAGAKPPCVTHVFLGAKGGAGTTTVAVNCGVELARLTKRSDHHRRPEDVPRRSRAVPRRPAAVHRARRDREPAPPRQGLPQGAGREAQVRARHPRRIGTVRSAERRRTPAALEELLRVLTEDLRLRGDRRAATSSMRPLRQRCMRPTRFSWSPTPTCRRSAMRSGWSSASGSLGPAASGSRSSSTACPNST